MVLRLLLHIWSGCGGLLNGVAVADAKRRRRGDAPYRAWSRCSSAAQSALLRGASLWAAECGMHVIWPCGGVRQREMRVEGRRRRRRPWKPNVINKMRVVVTFIRSKATGHTMLLLCRFRSCDSSGAIPERSPTPLYYPLLQLAHVSSNLPNP